MAMTDLKYVIAYSSVSHMGVVMLGAATMNVVGLNGSVFQMFAHGIIAGLFLALVGLVYEKSHSRAIFTMGGFGTMMPGIATAFTIAGLSSLGLPATAGFVAEFLTFLGAWSSAHPWWLFPGVLGAFLTTVYVLRVTKQIFWGPQSPDPHFAHLPDAQGPEWAALGILAICAKKLFLASAALGVLASLALRQSSFNRRAAEYHFVLLASVLGMLVLASARELILLFVSFELMSIPLYVLTGFVKREDAAPEAALKFFLVGTASSAVIVYGMSFIFGVTGSTELSAIPGALATGDPMMLLGMTLLLAGLGFKIAAFPFHMW